MSPLACAIFLVLLPYFVAPEESYVFEYGSENFKQQIQEMDGNFIMFYAPWCRHCTEFQPIWNELAEMVNTQQSKFAIAEVDCTIHSKLCHENDITGYPTLLYFHKNTFTPVEFKGTRDLPSLTLFLSEVFNMKTEGKDANSDSSEVKTYGGVAYLTDQNFEKFLSKGQHFVMFYAPWCSACQKLAPVWAALGAHYAHSPYMRVGKVDCMDNELTCQSFDIKQYPHLLWIASGRIVGVSDAKTLGDLKAYAQTMLQSENHDPDKFLRREKALPVARISEETFEAFLEKDLVFINYFAPWCAHCMQLNPLWVKLGERFINESRVIIADVDCARSKPVCEMEKINIFPTLVLYKNKRVVITEHGGKPLDSLVALVSTHLDPPAEAESEVARDEL